MQSGAFWDKMLRNVTMVLKIKILRVPCYIVSFDREYLLHVNWSRRVWMIFPIYSYLYTSTVVITTFFGGKLLPLKYPRQNPERGDIVKRVPHSGRLRLIYKNCSVFWSLGTHDKFSRTRTPEPEGLKAWLRFRANPRPCGGKVLCNSCITEMRSTFSKRLVRRSSNVVNSSFFDKSTSSVSLKMFSVFANLKTSLVISSFVSGISANFSRRHLSMVMVFWCTASPISLKLWLCWIRMTKRVDSFPRKT